MNETKTNTGATVYKEVCEYFEHNVDINVTKGYDDVTVCVKRKGVGEMFPTNELQFLFSVMIRYHCRFYITTNLDGQLTATLWKWWSK